MLHPKEGTPSNNEAMETRVQSVMKKREQAIDAINQTARTKQTLTSQYKLGDQVWLEATHLKICHQKTKLKPKWYRPFRIIKEVSPVAY
jgi:hypothetical protein